jgi:hypothetical protein
VLLREAYLGLKDAPDDLGVAAVDDELNPLAQERVLKLVRLVFER